MEASAAGLAGDAAQADAGEGQGEQQQQQQGGVDEATLAAFNEALQNGLTEQQEAFREQLQELTAAQQPGVEQPAEQEPAPDLGFLADPDPERAAQGLQEFMASVAGAEAQKAIEQVLGPVQQQVNDMRLDQESAMLAEEFPELKQPEVAQKVVDEAHRQATMLGHPELVANTSYLRTVYQAMRAQELAQQQASAASGAGVATLEGAGGAGPAGVQQGGPRTAEQIAESWGKGRTDVLSQL